jgi:hypothetical protein
MSDDLDPLFKRLHSPMRAASGASSSCAPRRKSGPTSDCSTPSSPRRSRTDGAPGSTAPSAPPSLPPHDRGVRLLLPVDPAAHHHRLAPCPREHAIGSASRGPRRRRRRALARRARARRRAGRLRPRRAGRPYSPQPSSGSSASSHASRAPRAVELVGQALGLVLRVDAGSSSSVSVTKRARCAPTTSTSASRGAAAPRLAVSARGSARNPGDDERPNRCDRQPEGVAPPERPRPPVVRGLASPLPWNTGREATPRARCTSGPSGLSPLTSPCGHRRRYTSASSAHGPSM